MINSKYLGSLAISGWCDWYYVFCYFLFIGGFFRENLQKYTQKIPFTKMSTWGITSMKNALSAHCFIVSSEYLSVKTCIISKPFNWFAKLINWLVSIWSVFTESYFRTDYKIVCAQGDGHNPLESQVIIMERKWFFYQAYIPWAIDWLNT